MSAGLAPPALTVAHAMQAVDGRRSHAIAINGTVPAPLMLLAALAGTPIPLSAQAMPGMAMPAKAPPRKRTPAPRPAPAANDSCPPE